MSQQQNAVTPVAKLPGAIKALFERIITNDSTTRNDWMAVAKELCVDKDGVKSYDSERKAIRTEQFAVMYCAKICPDEPAGSDEYKAMLKRAQQLYGSFTNRAL